MQSLTKVTAMAAQVPANRSAGVTRGRGVLTDRVNQ